VFDPIRRIRWRFRNDLSGSFGELRAEAQTDNDPLPEVAIHEAAHAVVAIRCGLEVRHVSIVSDLPGVAGHTARSHPEWWNPGTAELLRYSDDDETDPDLCRHRDYIEAYIMESLAGAVAVELYTGIEASGACADIDGAIGYAYLVTDGDQDETEAYIEGLRQECQRLLGDPAVRARVEAVAGALTDRGELTGDEISRILEGL